MIIIVNYGLGNHNSILNMLKKVGADALVTSDISAIKTAKKIILPGVGAFDEGIKNLERLGIISILKKKVFQDGIPLLGICLGMQLLAKKSEEGSLPGLGLVDSEIKKFRFKPHQKFKIPHMGWNYIKIQRQSPLLTGLDNDSRFYFVHSYYMLCNQTENILTTTDYGYDFVSSIQKMNIFGVQFHPEKSHKFGMRLLKNFMENL